MKGPINRLGKRYNPFVLDLSHKVSVLDFDGHTSFQSLTFTQRLSWLSEVAVSIYMLAKSNPDAGCCSFFEFTRR